MIESSPSPPPAPHRNRPPFPFILFILFSAIPFCTIIFASISSEGAHAPILPYVFFYLLALMVTVLLDYFAITHIWKSDSYQNARS